MKSIVYIFLVLSMISCNSNSKTKTIPETETTPATTIPKNSIQLLRNATTIINIGDKKILLDPMLAEKGAYSGFQGAGNELRNPLVDLPISDKEIVNLVNDVDAVFVTHTHSDHWDKKAQELIPKDKIIYCQPSDQEKITAQGFTKVIAITDTIVWNNITVHRTSGQHGFGEVGALMGDVSGFVFHISKDEILYIAGDTRWVEEVDDAITQHNPTTIILNAGGAQFIEGPYKSDPITMTPEDIQEVYKKAPDAQIIAMHMNSLNHCHVTKTILKEELQEMQIEDQISILDDGEQIFLKTQ